MKSNLINKMVVLKIRCMLCLFFLIVECNSSTVVAKPKKVWTFGTLSALSYDSDLGFQYSALVNLYDYGKGTSYPEYNHSLFFELSTYTKGTFIARFRYDSDKLFKVVRSAVDISHVTDQLSDFDGYQSVIIPECVSLKNKIFYKFELDMFRVKIDLHGFFGPSRLGWLAGYSYFNFRIDSVNTSHLGICKI